MNLEETMSTAVYTQVASRPYTRRVAPLVSPETRQLMSLGQQRGWNFRVLMKAPMLKEPKRMGDWLAVPAHQDDSHLPDHAMERVKAIFEAGIRPVGFVMVHEVPKMLPAPAQAEPTTWRMPALPENTRSTLKKAGTALFTAAFGLLAITGVVVAAFVALVVAAAVILPLAFLAAAVSIDPILVAVTEDGLWVEVDRWDV